MVSFWVAALGLPLLAVVGNAFGRWLFRLPQSAPADVVLAFVIFDALVVLQGHEFAEFVGHDILKNEYFRDGNRVLFGLAGAVGLIFVIGELMQQPFQSYEKRDRQVRDREMR